jgi:hypothetical protein
MTTPKSLRTSPPRTFENYTLNRVLDERSGLVHVSDATMRHVPGDASLILTGSYDISQGGANNALSVCVPIGFNFQLGAVTYKNMIVSTNGYVVLADPAASTAVGNVTNIVNGVLDVSASADNSLIRSTISSNSSLLCPWFDNMTSVIDDLSKSSLSSDDIRRTLEGHLTPPENFNPVQYGVLYHYGNDTHKGRFTAVRWNSQVAPTTGPTIKFELVLYESGTIEFRYVSRSEIRLINNSGRATVGIFVPGVNRFRDFSKGLGYTRDQHRREYKYGGAVFSSGYTDGSAVYTINLQTNLHWPGTDGLGATFVFQPPKARRKVLPRLLVRDQSARITLPMPVRTGDPRSQVKPSTFDDRRSAPFTTGTVVNYPTTLQRFFGGNEGSVHLRQDLFTDDFQFTGSIVPSAVEQFLADEAERFDVNTPFVEDKLPEQAPNASSETFFKSGTIETSQPLRSKTIVRMSLPLDYETTMFAASSSIYYWNSRTHRWGIPFNTTSDAGSGRGDIMKPTTTVPRIVEDARGFGPVGNVVSSGSNSTATGQSDFYVDLPFTPINGTDATRRAFAKSVSANESYRATQNETFKLPISHPFVIEKAVIEIPFKLGDGWFNDRTQALLPISSSVDRFDLGGPGITVALFAQHVVGSSTTPNALVTRRDLILTGTITHRDDDVSEVVVSNFPPHTTIYQPRRVGFRAFGNPPAAVVDYGLVSGRKEYTGSVVVKTEPLISNGVTLRLRKDMSTSTAENNRTEMRRLLSQELLTLQSSSAVFGLGFNIAYINTFGRGQTGFEPSGRSVFGKEYTTSQNILVDGKVANPFYVSGTLPSQIQGLVQAGGGGDKYAAVAAVALESHQRAPYMVLPGDNLVLAISKTRPVMVVGNGIANPFSGSITHDVQLTTGSVSITLYGSLIRNDEEFHDTLAQATRTNSVHTLIGDTDVLDQYDVPYRDQYVGGVYDDYLTGSLVRTQVNAAQKKQIVTGFRGRVMSKHTARLIANDTGNSKAFNAQPWYERAGTPRFTSAVDNSEQYWDSMMPSIVECFRADGTGIWFQENQDGQNRFGVTAKLNKRRFGYMLTDYQVFPLFSPTSFGSLLNGNWNRSYPFEPRYRNAPRQKVVQRSFIATQVYRFNSSGGTVVAKIEPIELAGFYFGVAGYNPRNPRLTNLGANPPNTFIFGSDCDKTVGTGGFVVTGSMNVEDSVKALYGFGDMNTIGLDPFGQGIYIGTNHWPEFRVSEIDDIDGTATQFRQSPVIRGWKHGVISGAPYFSRAYFRQGRYGQMRDMLEQRRYSRFFNYPSTEAVDKSEQGVGAGPVIVKFVDGAGNITSPANTQSSNLNMHATSSFPYLDDVGRNRPEIVQNALNANILGLNSNEFGETNL